VLAALAPGVAPAAVVEVRSTLSTAQSYDSNVLSSDRDERDEFVTDLSPELTLRARGDRGSLGTTGKLRARKYWDLDPLDALDRTFTVDGTYWLTPRLQAWSFASDLYRENTDEFEENGVIVAGGAPDLRQLSFSGGMRYLASPRTTITLTPQFSTYDFGDPEFSLARPRTDVSTGSVALGLDRVLSVRDTVGFELTGTDNTFEQPAGVSDTESFYQQARLRWTRSWSPTWSSTLSAGATQVLQDKADVSFEPVGGGSPLTVDLEDTALTTVGDFSITRSTLWTALKLRVTQSISPSSGFGTDLTVLTLASRFDWKLSKRWMFTVGASWSDSRSASDSLVATQPVSQLEDGSETVGDTLVTWAVPVCDARSRAVFTGRETPPIPNPVGEEDFLVVRETACFAISDSAIDYQQAGFDLGLNWQMSRRFSTFLRYRFIDQTSGGDSRIEEFDKSVVSLGFTYRYDVDLY
jgi:hypothetical protein